MRSVVLSQWRERRMGVIYIYITDNKTIILRTESFSRKSEHLTAAQFVEASPLLTKPTFCAEEH